jgi:hypothetical protein
MTRAVAEKGTELVQGIHAGHPGLAITIKQANGIVREVPFDEEDGATPVLIEAMILELDIEGLELREATKQYCLAWFIENPDCEIPLSEFYTKAEAFIAGYKAAFNKVEPYWRNPFPGN